MSLSRIVGAAATVAVAAGAGLLLASSTGAATPPPPTPLTLAATGMTSSSCPLPLNGSVAFTPGTTVGLLPDPTPLAKTINLSITPAPDSTDPKSSKIISSVPAAGSDVAFTRTASYQLVWQVQEFGPLGAAGATLRQTGKLVISANAQKCVVAVRVPVPSISASAVPSAVTSTINGALSSAVGAVNGGLSPVNSAVGPVLGGVEPTVAGGLPGGGLTRGPGAPPASPAPGSTVAGTTYKPTGPTVADRTVPKGYGNGSGVGGSFVSVTGGSITAAAHGFITSDGKRIASRGGAGSSAPARSAGSPRTVELAAHRPRSALSALPTLAVILAILALSGATAFYARTFLLQPVAARVKH